MTTADSKDGHSALEEVRNAVASLKASMHADKDIVIRCAANAAKAVESLESLKQLVSYGGVVSNDTASRIASPRTPEFSRSDFNTPSLTAVMASPASQRALEGLFQHIEVLASLSSMLKAEFGEEFGSTESKMNGSLNDILEVKQQLYMDRDSDFHNASPRDVDLASPIFGSGPLI